MLSRLLILTVLVLATALTQASELTPALKALFEGFSAHRRVALGYLRTGNIDLADVEIERLIERLRKDPPKPGPIDSPFQQSLADTEQAVVDSLDALRRGDTDTAAAQLARAAMPLKAWRDAVGIRLFSDCITELSQAYARLDIYRRRAPDLGNLATREAIIGSALGTEAAVRRCDGEAPAQVKAHVDFRRLIEGMLNSLRQIPDALRQPDSNYLHRLLIEQRSFEQLLAFRFG